MASARAVAVFRHPPAGAPARRNGAPGCGMAKLVAASGVGHVASGRTICGSAGDRRGRQVVSLRRRRHSDYSASTRSAGAAGNRRRRLAGAGEERRVVRRFRRARRSAGAGRRDRESVSLNSPVETRLAASPAAETELRRCEASRKLAETDEGTKVMLGGERIASVLAVLLLLTPSSAQSRSPQPQRPPQSHPQQHLQPQRPDGQWHRFQKEGRPNPSRPNEARPPQNQPGHAGNWLRRYKDLPPAQQRRALENDSQFRKLPPEHQARLQNRLQHFSNLPPQQQEHVLNRMETWEHLTPDQKQHARQLFQQFRQLPPDRRQAVNRAIRGMRDLTPEQRDRLIDSNEYKSTFSPQERRLLGGASHLPLAPGEGLHAEPPEE